MKRLIKLGTLTIVFGCATGAIFAQNYKIRQSTSMGGQNIGSTVYVKGMRKRTESSGMMGIGADVATIEQCDLKRSVKVSDKKKQYFVTPFATGGAETAGAAPRSAAPGKATKGGTLTMTSSINDTGERKQMFGLTARHIKTSMKMESSPDACSPVNMAIQTDGWYVDLPQFSCPLNGSASTMPYQRPARNGCQDRTILKETGSGKLGFPLQYTQTLDGGDSGDGSNMSQSLETLEFSKATLDDSLFDVPAGYTVAKQEQDLYGRPDFSSMMRGADDDEDKPKPAASKSYPSGGMPAAPAVKRPGVRRIGVLVPTLASDENISTNGLQSFLVQQLTSGNVEAVAVSSEGDARAKSCDFILTSSFSKLKQTGASKVGGLFGKITNTDSSGAKSWDVQVDYSMAGIDGRSVLNNKAALKAGGSADTAAEAALAMEVSAVAAAAK